LGDYSSIFPSEEVEQLWKQ